MNYYDQHLHTHHSFDSEESFENYLNTYSPDFFVTTEHLDLKNPCVNGKDSIPDYHLYNEEINRLSLNTHTNLLKGIEIGYVNTQATLLNDFLKGKEYDVILLSIHQNGVFDYMDDDVLKLDTDVLINDYYSRMLDAVKSAKFGNILTHFDYGVRRLNLSVNEFRLIAEPYLVNIFKNIIEKNIAFELNAKSFIKYGNKELYEYAIPLYISLGGKLFTLGSDAHVAEDYELGFKEMKNLLIKNGIFELAVYQKQQLIMVNI